MAEINAKVRNVDDSAGFVNSSRGTDANMNSLAQRYEAKPASTAAADTFKSFGDLFNLGAAAAEVAIRDDIDSSVTEMTDSLFNEFGVNDAANIEAEAGKGLPPAALERSFQEVERLRTAVDKKAISMGTFNARLLSMSRQLRSKYAGHREYIDQKIASITGERPANAVLRDLMRERDNSASDRERNNHFKLVKGYVEDAVIPPGEIDKAMEMDQVTLLKTYGFAAARKADLKQREAELDYNEKLLKADDNQRTRLLTRTVDDYAMTIAEGVFRGASPNGDGDASDITALIRKANNEPAKLTAEEQTILAARTNELITGARVGLQKILSDERFDMLPADKRAQATAPFEDMIKNLENSLTNKVYGTLFSMHNQLESVKTGAQASFLLDNKSAQWLHAADKVIPGFNDFIMKLSTEEGLLPAVTTDLQNSYARMISEPDGSLSKTMKELEASGKDTKVLGKTIISASLQVLNDPNASPAAVLKHSQVLFGPENAGFINTVKAIATDTNGNPVPQAGMLFNQLANKQVFDRMVKLREQGGAGTQAYDNYVGWVKNSFGSVFRKASDTIANQNASFAPLLVDIMTGQNPAETYVSYSKETNNFTYTRGGEVGAAVANINAGINAMKPILKEQGVDINTFLAQVFTRLPGSRVVDEMLGRVVEGMEVTSEDGKKSTVRKLMEATQPNTPVREFVIRLFEPKNLPGNVQLPFAERSGPGAFGTP